MMCFAVSLLLVVAAVAVFGVPFWIGLLSIITMIPFCLLHGAMVLFDLRKPKLDWDNEMQLVKNNFRILIPMLFNITSIILIGLVMFMTDLDIWMCFILYTAVYIILLVLVFLYVHKKDFALAARID